MIVSPLAVARLTGDALLVRTCGACHRPIEGVQCAPCSGALALAEVGASVALAKSLDESARERMRREIEEEPEHGPGCRCADCKWTATEDEQMERYFARKHAGRAALADAKGGGK